MAKEQNFTVIKLSGRADFYSGEDYLTVLAAIHLAHMSAGSNWDAPNMLLLNGKVVVSEKLYDIAWKYGQRKRELHAKAAETLAAEFKPAWEETDND